MDLIDRTDMKKNLYGDLPSLATSNALEHLTLSASNFYEVDKIEKYHYVWQLSREGNGTPTPVLLPGKPHGWRNLVGCSPWGREESDMTEWLHFQFSLLCIGEGNGNPLQCSCLENPRDGGAWWAAVYWVAQSRTRLKRLSSSSSTTWETCASSLQKSLLKSFANFFSAVIEL